MSEIIVGVKLRFNNSLHKNFDDSSFTRIMSRIDELAHLLVNTKELISKININDKSHIKPLVDLKKIENGNGISVVEACRGSLYHKIEIKNGTSK